MEHLSTLQHADAVDIPYLCLEEYDRQSFAHYPFRKSWNKSVIYEGGAYGGKSPQEVEAFFQTWLYFGMLCEIFGISGVQVEFDHFIRDSEGSERFITTARLPHYIKVWKEMEQSLSAESTVQKEARWNAVQGILNECRLWISRFCLENSRTSGLLSNFRPEFWPTSPAVSLSISVLWDSLYHASFSVFNRGLEEGRHFAGHSSVLLSQRMLNAGWCLSDVAMVRRRYDIIGQYYCSSYQPPHHISDHSGCSELECLVHNMDEANYRSMHTHNECHCLHIEPPSEDIASIIQSGSIPVLNVSDGSDPSSEEISILEAHAVRYVAISHVWSHGLGNPSNNSLPRCQLLRIQHAVNSLFNSQTNVAFWIDTLCIPNNSKAQDVRKSALRDMNKIFTLASAVLVLDADIRHASTHSTWVEQFVRISMSRWCSRLWTLAEGVLADNLYFELCDGFLKWDQLMKRPVTSHLLNMPTNLLLSIVMSESALSIRRDLKSTDNIPEHFKWVVSVVQHRNTTKSEDESVCIALLMNQDISRLVVHNDPQIRMKQLYSHLGKVPRWILFESGPRMSQTSNVGSYSWAPRSFLQKNRKDAEDHPWQRKTEGVAIVDQGGVLHYSGPSYWLNPGKLHLRHHFFKKLTPYTILRVFDPADSADLPLPQRQERASWFQIRYIVDGNETPYVKPSEALVIIMDPATNSESETIGALVALIQHPQQFAWDWENARIQVWCRFVCRVGMGEILPGSVNVFKSEAWRDHVELFQTWAEIKGALSWRIV